MPDAAHGRVPRVVRSIRKRWRRGRSRWHNVRPVVLAALALSSLVLGTIGFMHLRSVPKRYDFFDSLFRAMTLFGLGGAVGPPVPTTLQIARFLAPVLTGYAAVGTLLALLREQARVASIRLFVRNHVVVAGMGATGSRLALALVDQEPVVVIESDPANERRAAAHVRGVRVLTGEATDEVILRRAGIRHARSLVISCGADGTNVDVAAAATRAVQSRSRPLTIFSHLRNLDLWTSLAAEGATFAQDRDNVRLEYFNVLATGAQLLLERHAPFSADEHGAQAAQEHVLVVGLEGVGEQLVLQIARIWISAQRAAGDELRITLSGPAADVDLAALRIRYPALERHVKLGARQLELDSASFQAGAAMFGDNGALDVTRAYVSLVDEGEALLAALALHAHPEAVHVPVTVAVADSDAGIAVATGSDHGRFRGISAFGVLSAATSHELLLRGTNELLARAQHAQWLRNEQAKGTTRDENQYMCRWEELDEAQREVNRRNADDLHTKLSMVDCMLVPMPLPDPEAAGFRFTDEELERLAVHEHKRWMDEKRDSGWRRGEHTDPRRKIHEQLKPWEELDEPNREKDRDAVREIPIALARAGFRIQRRTAAAPVLTGARAASGNPERADTRS